MSATEQAGPPPPAKNISAIRASGKMVARQAGGTSVQAFFEANKATLTALLPRHMTSDRMLKIAMGALRTTPKLMECTIESLFGAVVQCAQLGLEPNTPQGHIYLIPFNNSRKNTTEVQVIIGYKGLIDLARRSGQIVSISARVRYANDPFKLAFGTDDYIQHSPPEDGDRGQVVGVYAVAKLKDGGVQFEYLTLSEVTRIRDNSEGYKAALATAKRYSKAPKHPWIDHFDEMARKTAIRRLCKYLPMSIELASAVALEDHGEGGKPQNLGAVLDGVEYTVQADDAPGEDGDDDAPAVSAADGAATPAAAETKPAEAEAAKPTVRSGPEFKARLDARERGEGAAIDRADAAGAPAEKPPAEAPAPALPLRGGAGQRHAMPTDGSSGGQTHAAPPDDGFGNME
jgi:recombination protein RecT